MSSSKITRTNVRPIAVVSDKLSQLPEAQVNLSGFVRMALHQFVARGAVPESTRALSRRFDCKTAEKTETISLLKSEMRDFKRYAKASGDFRFGALVQSALVALLFPGGPESPQS